MYQLDMVMINFNIILYILIFRMIVTSNSHMYTTENFDFISINNNMIYDQYSYII